MRLRGLILAGLAVVGLMLAAPAPGARATEWPKSDVPSDPAVTLGVLPNGMRYAIMRNETPKGEVSIRMRIAAGAEQESPAQRGLAHFVEHMAFRGSLHVKDHEIEKTLAAMGLQFGADINASTGQDQTVYQFDLPNAQSQTVQTALNYMREIAGNLTFDPEAAESEAGVVLSELRLRDVPAYRALQKRLDFTLVDPHATALPNGDPAVIAAAPVDQLRAFYRAYYRPDRTTLIVAGDISPADIENRIRALFFDWKVSGEGTADPVLSIPFARGEEGAFYGEAGAPSTVAISWLAPPPPRPENRAEEKSELIGEIGMVILDRRCQEAAASSSHPFNRCGISRDDPLRAAQLTEVGIAYAGDAWKSALAAEETIRLDMVKNGVTQAEVDRAVTELHAVFAAASAGAATRPSPRLAGGILRAVSDNDIYSSPARDLAAFEEDTKDLSAATVSAAFAKLFQGGGPLIFVSAPMAVAGGDAAVKTAFDDAEKQAAAAVHVAAVAPSITQWSDSDFGVPGRVVETKEVADLGVTYVRFANGVRLTVRPSKLRADQVLISVKVGGGRLELPKDRATAMWAASGALILGGFSDMSYQDMQRVLAGKIYSAGFALGEDGFVLSGATVPSDLDTQLQLLTAYIAKPGYRPEGLAQVKAQMAAQLQQMDANPSAVFGFKAPQYLHPDDMRWKFTTPEDVATVKIDDVRAVLDPAFAHGPIDVIVTGDITAEAAIKAVAATLGALPARDAARPALTAANATYAPPAGAIVLKHAGSPGQDIESMIWPTHGRFPDIQDDVTQALTAAIMQERLFNQLRGEGVTYVAEVGAASSKVFDYGFIQALAQIPGDQTAKFTEAVNGIVADLQAGHITPDELERARVPALNALDKARQGNEYWLSALDDTYEHPDKLSLIRDYEADLRKVTAADIAACAKKYLVPGKLISLNVGT